MAYYLSTLSVSCDKSNMVTKLLSYSVVASSAAPTDSQDLSRLNPDFCSRLEVDVAQHHWFVVRSHQLEL